MQVRRVSVGFGLAFTLTAAGPAFAQQSQDPRAYPAAPAVDPRPPEPATAAPAPAAPAEPAPPPPPPVTVKPYGILRLDIIGDSAPFNSPQSPITVSRFQPGVNPSGEFSLHPRLTRLGLDARSRLAPEVTIDGKVEIDFQNGGRESRATPRMRHAYAELSWGAYRLLFGQTWQLVSRLIPMANADTLMWGVGNAGDRAPQLRISRLTHFDDGKGLFSLEAAAQMIGTVDNAGQAGLNFGSLPAVQARAALQALLWTTEPFVLATSVHFATEHLNEKVVGQNQFQQVGVFGELVVPFYRKNGLRGEAFLGRNLSDVRGGIGQGINPVRDLEIRARGFWAELYSEPAKWLALGVGAGMDDPNDDDLEAGQATLNRAGWGVVHFRPFDHSRIGVEYLYWVTDYKEEPVRIAHRVNGHLQWEF